MSQTKYELNQEVWVMYNKKPIKCKIKIITLTTKGGTKFHVAYEEDYSLNKRTEVCYQLINKCQQGLPIFKEHEMFLTKEDLIKSLIDEN